MDSIGCGNSVVVGESTYLTKTRVKIRGNNNIVEFGEHCIIGKNCSFWAEGNNIHIIVGTSCTFTHTVHFCAQENNTSIEVGEDCMFSNKIVVRTSDSHPIYDLASSQRINMAKSVKIGNHVWIAPDSKIMKGAIIGDGAIIGSNTMVSKEVPSNALAVGTPAKVIKSNVNWTREKLF